MNNPDFLNQHETEYCNFYKQLLVEELSLCPPHMLHNGKCSLIGITMQDPDTGLYLLGNVRIDCLERDFRIPTGSTKVILFTSRPIPADKAFEVFGEVVLYDRIDFETNELPKDSNYLLNKLKKLKPENIGIGLEKINNRYLPGLLVHSLSLVNNPRELIECNLRLRCLRRC